MNKEAIANYLQENGQYIILVVILIIGTMVFFSIIGIDLNPVVNNNLEKVVTIEKFTNNSFCDSNSNLKTLEENCNKLTKDNCDSVDCCEMVSVNDSYKCKASNKHGIIYKEEDFKKLKENMTNLDNKYYENYENTFAYKEKEDEEIYRLNQGTLFNNQMEDTDGYFMQQSKNKAGTVFKHKIDERNIYKIDERNIFDNNLRFRKQKKLRIN